MVGRGQSAALKKFQEAQKLEPTGSVNLRTLRALGFTNPLAQLDRRRNADQRSTQNSAPGSDWRTNHSESGRLTLQCAVVRLTAFVVFTVGSCSPFWCGPAPRVRAPGVSRRACTAEPPVIDGTLDDAAWQQPPLPTGEFLSYNPLHGSAIPQKTTVWLAYDSDYLYFAFKCDDPDPSGDQDLGHAARQHLAGRLGRAEPRCARHRPALLSPDGQPQRRAARHAEQRRRQRRSRRPTGSGTAPSRLTDTGYTAEIRLPLQSIRFKGGDDTRMGILFWRRVSRLGRLGRRGRALEPGVWVFERHASVHFDNLQPRLRARDSAERDLRPHRRCATRRARWAPPTAEADFGVSTKVGLTSTITLDATLNPDFSQVESDAFQVEVNQRFPVFFGEKRPFFMEGAGIFALAGAGSRRQHAAHRRAHAAHHRSDLRREAHRQRRAHHLRHPVGGRRSRRRQPRSSTSAARSTASARATTSVRSTPTSTSDGTLQPRRRRRSALARQQHAAARRLRARLALARRTEAPTATSDVGLQVNYNYSTRKWGASGSFEHYGEDFRMDTAFMNRVGVTGAWGYVERNFYPDNTKHPCAAPRHVLRRSRRADATNSPAATSCSRSQASA